VNLQLVDSDRRRAVERCPFVLTDDFHFELLNDVSARVSPSASASFQQAETTLLASATGRLDNLDAFINARHNVTFFISIFRLIYHYFSCCGVNKQNVVSLSVILLNVVNVECRFVECPYIEYRNAEIVCYCDYRYAECRNAE
jgi:hypothetical protein